MRGHAQCLHPRASPCHAILLILMPRWAAITCTPEFWLFSARQGFETEEFTPQTRLGHIYSSYLQYLGLPKAVSSADLPWAKGSGKLISNSFIPETYSTVHLWCIANAVPPRSQWICGHWMTIQCLPPQIDSRRPYIIYLFRDTKLVALKNHRIACIGKDF